MIPCSVDTEDPHVPVGDPKLLCQLCTFSQDPQFSFPVLRDRMARGLLAHRVRDFGHFRRCLCGRGHLPRLHPLQRDAVLRLGAGKQEGPAPQPPRYPEKLQGIPDILFLDLRIHPALHAHAFPGKVDAGLYLRKSHAADLLNISHVRFQAPKVFVLRKTGKAPGRRPHRGEHMMPGF